MIAPTVLRAAAWLWTAPNTLLGLVLAALAVATGGGVRWHTGVIEAHGGLACWLLRHATLLPAGAAAITFGHVVLAVDRPTHDLVRDHERVHVRQYERWGPLFIPAYLLASLLAVCRGASAYHGNCFEHEAFTKTVSDTVSSIRRAG